MGTLLDLASLVVVPSGYKEDIIYSVVPTDGSGDLQFTRASSATRVNSAGLIEKVRTNLSTYSEDFANAAWSPSDITVTSNTQLAPNGTTTADVVMEGTGTAQHRFQKTLSLSSSFYTFSVYVKNISGTRQAYIDLGPLAAYFTFSTETIYTPTGFASVQNVGSGWYRITLSNLTAISISSIYLGLATGNSETYTGNGTSSIAFWGAQVETGDIATDYIPTTTAAVSVGMTADVPRLDYLGSSCPSLLLEPQRTNIALYSEQFTNAVWIDQTSNTTIEKVASTTAPDGYSFTRLVTTGSGSQGRLVQLIYGSETSLTYSLYVRGTGTTQLNLFMSGGGNTASPVITLTNSWQRISVSLTRPSGVTGDFEIRVFGGSTLEVFGAQLELGSYPTSYIPTLGASVTRVADAASKTGISSLIGQTEGTIFAEINLAKLLGIQSRYILVISDNTADNRIYIAFSGSSSNILRARIFSAGVQQISIDTATISSLGKYKLALAYNNNDAVLYVNGVQIGTDTSVTIPACSQLNVCANQAGASPFDDGINQALLFKTRLSNTELAQLTTL
jgi:hypothetical protein